MTHRRRILSASNTCATLSLAEGLHHKALNPGRQRPDGRILLGDEPINTLANVAL
jgi:hypothetical protein